MRWLLSSFVAPPTPCWVEPSLIAKCVQYPVNQRSGQPGPRGRELRVAQDWTLSHLLSSSHCQLSGPTWDLVGVRAGGIEEDEGNGKL